MTGPVFLDTETTGLDPVLHEVWEVGLIVDGTHYLWQLPVDLGGADARALDIGAFHARRWPTSEAGADRMSALTGDEWTPAALTDAVSGFVVHPDDMRQWAQRFAHLTWGRHIAGAVPNFDTERLDALLRANGACPGWHYHLIDVETMAVGYLNALYQQQVAIGSTWPISLPWSSDDLARAVGVDPDAHDERDTFGRHTALGDARMVEAMWDAITAPTITNTSKEIR